MDRIDGLAGNDRIYGNDGDDVLRGGTGNDLLFGGAGNDSLFGDAGNDQLSGGDGDDLLDGGTGADTLRGEGGSDTYVVTAGGGNDIISDGSGSTSEVDVLRLVGIDPSGIMLTRSGAHMLLTILATGEVIEIKDQFWSTSAKYGIERIEFADGTVWDETRIRAEAAIRGTPGNDTLYGSDGDDTFIGGLGDDRIETAAGSDTFIYASGDGNDFINEESGSTSEIDTLRFTDLNAADVTLSHVGNDLMIEVNATGHVIEVDEHFWSTTANYGIERIEFADGTSWDRARINAEAAIRGTSGNDTLYGTAFDDTFIGGPGDDRIETAAGSDTFVYASGDGNDFINEESGSTSEIDTLRFTDLNPDDVTLTHSGNDILIKINATGHVIEIDEQFWSSTAYYGIERIEFADGTVWDRPQIEFQAAFRGDAGNNTLNGTANADTLIGDDGDDSLYGHGGNDRLIGGGGSDLLVGGEGSDTFVFGFGSGADTIEDFTAGAGSDDVIEFERVFVGMTELLAASQQVGSDVLITVSQTDSLLLKNVSLSSLHADDFRFM